jgi:hypothetical protein
METLDSVETAGARDRAAHRVPADSPVDVGEAASAGRMAPGGCDGSGAATRRVTYSSCGRTEMSAR